MCVVALVEPWVACLRCIGGVTSQWDDQWLIHSLIEFWMNSLSVLFMLFPFLFSALLMYCIMNHWSQTLLNIFANLSKWSFELCTATKWPLDPNEPPAKSTAEGLKHVTPVVHRCTIWSSNIPRSQVDVLDVRGCGGDEWASASS